MSVTAAKSNAELELFCTLKDRFKKKHSMKTNLQTPPKKLWSP